jgi:hypothetical protein
VNHVLNNSDIFDQLLFHVENGTESTKIFQFLMDNTPIGRPKLSLSLVHDNEEVVDKLEYYQDESDDNLDNKSDYGDEDVNKDWGVQDRVAFLSQSFKDNIQVIYDMIGKQGKSVTTNNGLTATLLGINGYLTVTPIQFLLNYMASDSGYGIDFGGGFGYTALLLAGSSKFKMVCTEINFERYLCSIKLQNIFANQDDSTDGSMELKQKLTENVFFMFTGLKSNVEIDWSLEELQDKKRTIFGDSNDTFLTPRTVSVENNIPELISSNKTIWKFIYFFLLVGRPWI